MSNGKGRKHCTPFSENVKSLKHAVVSYARGLTTDLCVYIHGY